jgi:hypothetical protein
MAASWRQARHRDLPFPRAAELRQRALACARGRVERRVRGVRRRDGRQCRQGRPAVRAHGCTRSRRWSVQDGGVARVHDERAVAVLRGGDPGPGLRRSRPRPDGARHVHADPVADPNRLVRQRLPRVRGTPGLRRLRRPRRRGDRHRAGDARGRAGRAHRRAATAPPVAEAPHRDRRVRSGAGRVRHRHRSAGRLDLVLAHAGPPDRGRRSRVGRSRPAVTLSLLRSQARRPASTRAASS